MTFACRVPVEELDFDGLFAKLDSYQTFWGAAGEYVRGASDEDRKLPDFHLHFLARRMGGKAPGDQVVISYDLHRNESPTAARNSAASASEPTGVTVSHFPGLFAGYLKDPAKEYRGVLSANFYFEAAKWDSVVPLPFPAPTGVGQVLGGSPEIAGVDFRFSDVTSQPLTRAFVSTIGKEITLRLGIQFSTRFDDGINSRMINEAGVHAPLFVKPKRGSS